MGVGVTYYGLVGTVVHRAVSREDPTALLQAKVREDRASTLALAPYTAWLLLYDVPWTYQLWRLNPQSSR